MKMDSEGMYPQHPCSVCGKPLNADGGHPAELYAGTYTGLCYECERAPRIVFRQYEDGAIRYSYAPLCPSWRRDREYFTAYPDCTECHGNGRIQHYQSQYGGWYYYTQCRSCIDRFYLYPPRLKRNEMDKRRRDLIYRVANDVYRAALENACKKAGIKVSKRVQAPAEIANPLDDFYFAKFKRVLAKWNAMREKRYPDV